MAKRLEATIESLKPIIRFHWEKSRLRKKSAAEGPEKTVFKLTVIVAWEADDDEPPIPRYPKRELYNNNIGLFSTLENLYLQN